MVNDMNGGLTDPEPVPAENDIRTLLMQEMDKQMMQQLPPIPGTPSPSSGTPPSPATPSGVSPTPGIGGSPDPMMMAQALRG
jgi:hypothetical protein